MSDPAYSTTSQVRDLLQRLAAADPSARKALIEHSMGRLKCLARWQLRDFPLVARWEQTDDIVQGAAARLDRALRDVHPANAREFFGLCSKLIRRELLDLKRKLFGPKGIGAHHASPAHRSGGSKKTDLRANAADSTYDPHKLARWTELHEQIASLPDDLREVFELIWYHDLTHRDAADVLGIATKTVQRRWREARLKLHHLVDDS